MMKWVVRLSNLKYIFIEVIACLLILYGLPSGSAHAVGLLQTELTVQRNEIELTFPNSLTFHLEASLSSEAQAVYLNYGTNGRSCLQGTSRQAIDIEAGSEITASWKWDFTQTGSLPPGAEIWWEWEILLGNGESLILERMVYTLEDPRFDWKNLEDDRFKVVWTEGSNSFGKQILDIANRSLDQLEAETGVQMLEKIRLTIYPNANDIHGAIFHLPEWTGGIAVVRYNLVIIALPPEALEWADAAIPHEIAHLVIDVRTFNCMGINLPTWLAEGIATYAEGDLDAEQSQLLLDRLSEGNLPGLVTLASGFSANADEARLSYIYSAAVVNYLLDTYGAAKFDQLLGVMQSGKNANPALLQVYGLDTAGIDQAWRASLGFDVAPIAQEKTATPFPTQIPTRPLWTAAVNLTPTSTITPSPTRTSTSIPVTATPVSTQTSTSIPTPSATQDKGSPLHCLGGIGLGVLTPVSLMMIILVVLRMIRK